MTCAVRAIAAAVALVVAGPLSLHAAVADYVGRPIVSLRFVLEGQEVNDPTVKDVVHTDLGRPLSMADVRESITHLYSLGRFEDIRVDASLAPGGVALRYDLSPVHSVSKIVLAWRSGAAAAAGSGVPGVNDERLRRVIVERGGASPPIGRAPDLAEAVADALRQRGYLHARVTPSTQISHDPHRTTLVFTIEPGARTVVGDVTVAGSPGVPPAQFLAELGVSKGAPYERDTLAARIDTYQTKNRSRGFYLAAATPTVELVDDDRTANLTLTVDRGPHVRLVFEGDPLPENVREDLVPIAREGSVDEDLLEDSTNRIEELLHSQGYRDGVAPHQREQSDGELVITFRVKRGPEYQVARLDVSGNSSLPLSDLAPALRLVEGTPFSEARLEADISAVEDLYHRSGFVAAKAESAVEPQPSADGGLHVPVVVRIIVREGVQTRVGSVKFAGNQAIGEATLLEAVTLQPDRPFVLAQLAADRDALQLRYLNLGYVNATVESRPELSRDGTRADLLFTVREGPQIRVDHVLVVGNTRTSSSIIERELQLGAGDPLSREAELESQRRLGALGLFRRVTITELRHGDESRRDLLVAVEEAPATTIAYGGGFEGRRRIVQDDDGTAAVEGFEFAPRASFQIVRRNLFGKNRSATGFASVSLPLSNRDVTATSTPTVAEYRFLGTYREPRIFGTAADAFLNGTIEQQIRSSFDFRRRSVSADLARRLTPAVSVAGSYVLQRAEVFNQRVSEEDQLLIDRTFPSVRLSTVSLSLIRDTRNDQADPSAGTYVSANGQLAARKLGSQVGFVKSFFRAQMFRTVTPKSRIVFAANASLGLADGFAQEAVDSEGQPVTDPDGLPLFVDELPASERFYAGGDTTIRGFALDAVGVRHVPARKDLDTLDEDGFPLGGNAVLILNGELRVPVRGGLGVHGFVDAGNVFQRVTTMDLGAVRTAVGFGTYYRSPIGPIRVDIGFKVNRRPEERLTAWFITFGQAF